MDKDVLGVTTAEEKEGGGVVYRVKDRKLQFLIIHRKKQQDWTLPKGHVEAGETVEDCIVREVKEETGYDGDVGPFVGVVRYEHLNKEKGLLRKVEVRFHLVRPKKDEPGTSALKEVDMTRWMDYGKELFDMLTYHTDKEMLDRAVKLLDKKSNG